MAGKIKLLPEQVANQIAAGEVVDRPASVVKELVENALDAGASRLLVEIEQGGRRLIRVSDDGEGMSREDALLAIERHATSKLRASRDLFAIRTLGFRGEALPSIASVSEFTLVTREPTALLGTELRIEVGVIKSVNDAGAPAGTEITVRRLFFNLPARKKFLKSVDTEFGHIATLVSNMALARPDVHLTLIHNGRTVFDLPSSAELGGRLRHALGAHVLEHLRPLDRSYALSGQDHQLRIHGFISTPAYTRSSTRSLHIFVNRRFVRDRLINHAVFEAYRNLMPRGRYPLVALFLDLPPEAVDVNVHPAKHEIRFRDQAAVHEAVLSALTDALRTVDRGGARPEPFREARTSSPSAGPLYPENAASAADPELRRGVEDALRRFHERSSAETAQEPGAEFNRPRPGSFRRPETGPRPPPQDETFPAAAHSEPLKFSELRVIGQAAESFLLAESEDSLVIIDQHAAHERIAFERLRAEFKTASMTMQPLLFPDTIELTIEEAARVERHLADLNRLGFEVEPFGGSTVAVKALPALLAGADPRRILLEVVDRFEQAKPGEPIGEEVDEILAVMACHSVVRANKPMSHEEMRSLLAAMDQAEFPGHCPHGRDAVVRVKFRELEKWFGR